MEVRKMKLSWHDAAATLVVAVAVGLYWAFVADAGLPLVSGPRVLAVLMFVLGVTACAVGGGVVPADTEAEGRRSPGVWLRMYAAHGALAFGLMVFVLVTGSTGALAVLTGLVVALWLFTTVRRVVTDLRTPRRVGTP